MFPSLPLLRTEQCASGGLGRFIERLEPRCLLSAAHAPAVAPVPKTPLNYYAGAGTLTNAISPATTGVTTAPAAPTSTPTTPPVAVLQPTSTANSLVTAPATRPAGVSDLALNNSFSVGNVIPGSPNTPVTYQGGPALLGSTGASPFSSGPQFPLSSEFISVTSVSAVEGSGGLGIVSVFAGGT